MTQFPSFETFYRVVHGYEPFVWQSDLARAVAESGEWPRQISAPTGAGKTSVLDIAVWALARDVDRHGPLGRTVPLRTFLTVERRLVVDGACEHATAISDAIETEPELAAVRGALRKLLPEDWRGPALGVTSLHGGVREDRTWLRPVGAQIITCTVTQLASRSLFRGVGVSPGMLPVHAGLVGTDRMIFVDEPHLVPAAVHMWRECEAIQSVAPEGPTVGQTVVLGATVPDYLSAESPFVGSLEGDPSPAARARCGVVKPARLVEAPTPAVAVKELVSSTCEAWADRDRSGGDGVLVVVNTIATAQKVAAEIAKKLKKDAPAHLNVLTSTVRHFDRTGAAFGPDTLTVATQTVEVGVDLDACALVTELASMPALIQRFGRLNRTGLRETSVATVVVQTKGEGITDKPSIAVYGEDQLTATHELLQENAVDGVLEDLPGPGVPDETWAEKPRTCAVVDYLPRLTATRPPALAPWEALAFGPDHRDRVTVEVAWRDNLDILGDCPIHSSETIALPIGEVQSFIGGARSGGEFADTQASVSRVATNDPVRLSVRVIRDAAWVVPQRTSDVRPGETVVIDCSEGGYLASLGWSPKSQEPVVDHSVKAVCEGLTGFFDAALLLGEERVAEAVEVGEDLRAEVVEALPAMPETELIVHGRFVGVRSIHDGWSVGGWVSLADHSAQVERVAGETAALAGFDDSKRAAVSAAGLRHDAGKTDKAFQQMLGNFAGEPWAKGRGSRRRRAQGLVPVGWRHEVLSAETVPEDIDDASLVRHLILSHHGWGRPLVGHADTVIFNGDNFRELEERFGPWGLALLESVLRFADWEGSRSPRSQGIPWESLGIAARNDSDGAAAQRESQENSANSTVVKLTGPRPYSLTTVFAGIGALFAVTRQGDSTARIRYRDGMAELASSQTPVWDEHLASQLYGALLIASGHKDRNGNDTPDADPRVVKANKWHVRYREAALSFEDLARPMFFDAVPGDGPHPVSLPVFIRNGSPFHCLNHDEFEVPDNALFELGSGLVSGKMNGGIDVEADLRLTDGQVEDRYSPGLLAWSMLGMIALGMPGSEYGVGVVDGELRLALPRDWVAMDQIRDLMQTAPERCEFLSWRSASSTLSSYMKLWLPVVDG